MAANVRDLGPTLLGVCWTFAGLGTALVVGRFYVRQTIIRKIGWDDWLILVALIFAIIDGIFCTIAVSFGLGQHITALTPNQIMLSTKYIYICEFFAIMSPGFGRISYTFLLLEIIPPSKWRRRFLWAIIIVQFLVDIVVVIIAYAQCQPVSAFWDQSAGHCWPPQVEEYAGFVQSTVCTIADLLLALFPISLLWNLNMRLGQKISISIMMSLGIFAMISSIVKTVELQALAQGDITYANCTIALWGVIDAYMVIFAASIPTLRPLFGRSQRAAVSSNSQKHAGYFHRNRTPQRAANFLATGQGSFMELESGNRKDPRAIEEVNRDSKYWQYQVNVESNGQRPSQRDPAVVTKDITMTVTYETA